MKIFLWIMGLPLAIVAVLFAITNRQVVAMDLWPLPLAVNAPLYLPILAALGFGALFGAIAVWLAAGRARCQARSGRRKVSQLEREVDRLKSNPVIDGQALALPHQRS